MKLSVKVNNIEYNDEFHFKRRFPNITHCPPHIHDTYELYVFFSGDAKYAVEGNIYELNKNDILFTNRREIHSTIYCSDMLCEKISIHIRPSFLSEFICNGYNPFSFIEKRKPGYNNKISGELVEKHKLLDIIHEIEYYYNNALPESTIMLKAQTAVLLTKMSQIVNMHEEMPNIKNRKISDIIIYINENLDKKITLEQLSQKFFLSPSYVSRIFQNSVGYSFSEYLAQKRTTLAKNLISENLKFEEVVERCGFADYSNFYRTFKKTTGISPKAYKENIFVE